MIISAIEDKIKRIYRLYPLLSRNIHSNPVKADTGYPEIAINACANLFLAFVTVVPDVSAKRLTAITSPLRSKVANACPASCTSVLTDLKYFPRTGILVNRIETSSSM
jgi:hypothetical protein